MCNWLVAVHFSITDRKLTECELMDGRLQEWVFVNTVRSVAFLEDGELSDSLVTVSLSNGVDFFRNSTSLFL